MPDKAQIVKDFINMIAGNGAIFNVVFEKKDGSIRHMRCRLNVKKYVKGIGMRFNPEDYNLLVAYDLDKKKGYRMIPLERVLYIKCGNKILKFDQQGATNESTVS